MKCKGKEVDVKSKELQDVRSTVNQQISRSKTDGKSTKSITKSDHDKEMERYKPGEKVFYKPSQSTSKWSHAKIIKRISTYMSI